MIARPLFNTTCCHPFYHLLSSVVQFYMYVYNTCHAKTMAFWLIHVSVRTYHCYYHCYNRISFCIDQSAVRRQATRVLHFCRIIHSGLSAGVRAVTCLSTWDTCSITQPVIPARPTWRCIAWPAGRWCRMDTCSASLCQRQWLLHLHGRLPLPVKNAVSWLVCFF